MASGSSKEMPSRATTNMSVFSEEAIPEVDPSSTAGLLTERLQAWKHAVGYLEDYVSAVEKIHKVQSKEYEKALKAISHPLKEGHHFDQSLGGVAGFFENLRTNTQALISTNLDTEKAIKSGVAPILERLHKEIKHKTKELAHGAQKGAKEVEKARNTTQKQIELLGQKTASFESAGGKMTGADDPYVVKRGVLHRLHKQVLEENAHRNETISAQNNFQDFEIHVIQVLQQAMESLAQLAGGQGEKVRSLHSDMLGAIQRVPPDFEWKAFMGRSGDRLVDPSEPPRIVDAIQFANMDHQSTNSLIEGSLERKSRNKLSWGYSTGYYVVTPSKFLHEFKDNDNSTHDPKPELSIYLPDATIGQPNGEKFNIKGKDKSKTISSKLSGSSELAFKAHTAADAEKWFQVIKDVAGATGPAAPMSPTSPTSPMSPMSAASPATTTTPSSDKLQLNEPLSAEGQATGGGDEHKEQESGVTGGEKASTEPQSSGDKESAAGPSDAKATEAEPKASPTEEKKAAA